MPVPSINRMVHYMSHGTPDGQYGQKCRAAIITEVSPESKGEGQEIVGLCVLNPTGLFFTRDCVHDEGGETPGSADCASPHHHGNPFRYCPCGWAEAHHKGGTWHWPEQVPETGPQG